MRPEKRRAGRRIRKHRRAFRAMGLSLAVAGKAAKKSARAIAYFAASIRDPQRPTVAELNSGVPLSGVTWDGIVEP